jgi:hypothetical protein
MNFKIIILIIALIAAVTPAHADYNVNIFGANQWARLDSHTIIIYRYSRPICLVKTYGYIYPTSDIRFLDDYISNFDKMIVDREVVEIREVKRL